VPHAPNAAADEVAVESNLPKFTPTRLRTLPPLTATFCGRMLADSTGASYEIHCAPAEPMRAPMVKAHAADVDLAGVLREAQRVVVIVDHDTEEHTTPPRLTETELSSCPKFAPRRVIDAPPETGAFSCAKLRVGASKLSNIIDVPTTLAIVTTSVTTLRTNDAGLQTNDVIVDHDPVAQPARWNVADGE
jgi:hypothetical protein